MVRRRAVVLGQVPTSWNRGRIQAEVRGVEAQPGRRQGLASAQRAAWEALKKAEI